MQTPTPLPDDVDKLKAIIEKQREMLYSKSLLIDRMQTMLERYKQQRFAPSSEKHPGQAEMQFFNEAELAAFAEGQQAVEETDAEEQKSVDVPAHKRRLKKVRALPDHLERVEVHHELDPSERHCSGCGQELEHIGEDVSEQLGVLPQQYFVIGNIRGKYACSCKACIKTVSMPAQPIPGSQASPSLLAQIMVQKFLDGLALYRQEKIDTRIGLDLPVDRNQLTLVHCNDHARRRFAEVIKAAKKADRKIWVATKAIEYYKQLYRIEAKSLSFEPDQRRQIRQEQSVPIWDDFTAWAQKVMDRRVGHAPSRDALKYLLGHEESLRVYCTDGRLPISNIQSEHIAKTIALSRKNFLFADTPAGASAMIYSMLETARANGHNAFKYMSVVLAELPNATTLEQIEALLPWALPGDEVTPRFEQLPTP